LRIVYNNKVNNIKDSQDILTLYRNGVAVKKSGSGFNKNGDAPFRFVMQKDGNLVVYDKNDTALYASKTDQATGGKSEGKNAPYKLQLESNGNLKIIGKNNTLIKNLF
jgi:hypothetical protein